MAGNNIDVRFTSLNEIISHKPNANSIKELMSSFKCERDKDIEKFLKEKAIEFEKRKISRTYFWIDIKNKQIVGYFSIGLDVIALEGLSNNLKRKLNKGFTPNNDFLFTYLIGQIARNDNYSPKILSGKEIMNTALSKIKEAQDIVGGRVVCIDILNPQEKLGLVNFYESFGFKKLKEIRNNLYRYFLILR